MHLNAHEARGIAFVLLLCLVHGLCKGRALTLPARTPSNITACAGNRTPVSCGLADATAVRCCFSVTWPDQTPCRQSAPLRSRWRSQCAAPAPSEWPPCPASRAAAAPLRRQATLSVFGTCIPDGRFMDSDITWSPCVLSSSRGHHIRMAGALMPHGLGRGGGGSMASGGRTVCSRASAAAAWD